MKFRSFLRDKAVLLTAYGLALSFVLVFLMVLRLSLYSIWFIAGVLVLAPAAGLLAEYMQKRAYYRQVADLLSHLDKKFLLMELLERPSFAEGEIFYEVLRRTGKAMNDEIAFYKRQSGEYREFVETWVHEIKTPIASSKLLIENHPDGVTRSIGEEIDKIDGFVEQALYYSRSNSVEKDYLVKKSSLKELVYAAVRRHASSLIHNKVTVSVEEVDYTVYTDRKWVDFILGQLLVNSIKYKKDPARIRIYAQEWENSIALYLSDNGIGMTEADAARAFEKGFTGENGRRYAQSTGMGLYLCKKLCDKLGLSITLTAYPQNGTTVRIVFPKGSMHLI